MVSSAIFPVVTIFLLLSGIDLINCQSNTTSATTAVTPSGGSVLQQICLNVDEYRSMFTSILGDNSIFSRDTIAIMITWVDWVYNAYNRYKWVIDFAIGALTTLSVFLPGGPLMPIITKIVITIAMDSNMRRLIKEILYEVWTMIPPTGSEQYNVTMDNSMVVVRALAAPAARMFKRSVDTVNWSEIAGTLSQRFAELQRTFAQKAF